MFSLNALALLAITGSVIAAPVAQDNVAVVYETVVHTAVVTVEAGAPAPAPTPAPQPQQPKAEENVVYVTVKKPANNYPTQPKPTPSSVYVAPAPSSTVVEAPAEPTKAPSTSGGYMDVVDEWLTKLGLPLLEHSDKLENNALLTVQASHGEMIHNLHDGSMGQVLAPAACQPENFFKCFVGGWLCEKPNMPGMDGICSSASDGWYYTSTGHADILTNTGYKSIGCACADGVWGCDVA